MWGNGLWTHYPSYTPHRLKPSLLQVASFSTARRCLSSLRRWAATVFLNIPSFRKRLHASLDSAIIVDTSPSVNFIFGTSSERCFDSRSERSSPCLRVLASTPVLSILLGAGSGACVPCVAPATGLTNPAILLAVMLHPRCFPSSAPSSSSEFLGKPLSHRCPSSRKL